jgi:ABC-type transport system involved in cytochrome bd biosynthesis fused ATPase/permease subunit
MNRIVLLLAVTTLVVAMLAVGAGTAMAKSTNHTENAKLGHTLHHFLKGDNHSLKDAVCTGCTPA